MHHIETTPRVLTGLRHSQVAFNTNYFIGQIQAIHSKTVKVQFLKEEDSNFTWPTKKDITSVEPYYIFSRNTPVKEAKEGTKVYTMENFESITIKYQGYYNKYFKESNEDENWVYLFFQTASLFSLHTSRSSVNHLAPVGQRVYTAIWNFTG